MTSHKKIKKKMSPEQKREKARLRSFNKSHRNIFIRAGFVRLSPVDGIHFCYEGLQGELDDIFVYENVVILAEYTLSNASNLGPHAKGKAGIHNKITEDPSRFLDFFCKISEGVSSWRNSIPYTNKQLIVKMVYGSHSALEDHHKALFKDVKFISETERRYFTSLTRTIKKSSQFEIFEFLGIDMSEVGNSGVVAVSAPFDRFEALALPEEQSHFPAGFRIISFYVDPDALLRRCYVLRKSGWRDGNGLYQRLIIPGKISSIRSHLKEKRRVFANNIVITLPSGSKALDSNGVELDFKKISKPTPISLELERRANSIGIIDGQHRVLSYYEDLMPDPDIDGFRLQQNLLATGIIYPADMSQSAREKFEAGLFLEINSTQASAGSDIIQAIWVLLDPFRPVSVARVVVNRLAEISPLKGRLERTALDAGKLKTASIVAYGLQPLTKRSGSDSLFHIWGDRQAKARFRESKATDQDLENYISFCVETLSKFTDAIRMAVGDAKWRIVEKGGEGVLSVTTMIGIIILLRKLIDSKKFTEEGIFPDLSALSNVDFNSYKSSQYSELAIYMQTLIK